MTDASGDQPIESTKTKRIARACDTCYKRKVSIFRLYLAVLWLFTFSSTDLGAGFYRSNVMVYSHSVIGVLTKDRTAPTKDEL
jgi:hypothetical protein